LSHTDDALSAASLSIFPNPADHHVQLDFPQSGAHRIIIYDIHGKSLLDALVTTDQWKFNCAELNAGVYAVVVDGVFQRLIIER
jgi:hypothetical protein